MRGQADRHSLDRSGEARRERRPMASSSTPTGSTARSTSMFFNFRLDLDIDGVDNSIFEEHAEAG